MAEPGNVVIENAQLLFLNFEGKEGQYNREGDRSFCVLLDEETAKQLDADGWNVRALRQREPDDPKQPYIQVSVSYKFKPPKIVLITSRGRNDLSEAEVPLLDSIDTKKVDLIIRPREWLINGRSGIKAYLKTMFVTMDEDYLELKYLEPENLE